MRRRTVTVAALLALSHAVAQQVPWPTYDWTTSTPEAQGMDSAPLIQAGQFVDQNSPYRYSLLVVRNGALVFERYFHGSRQSDANNICSITKSITSVLVGIAQDEGRLQGIDLKLHQFYPQYFLPNDDPRKLDITLRHLLTMTAGYDASSDNFLSSDDFFRYIIQSPLSNTPGEFFRYNTGYSHLLSGIVTQVSGMSTLDYANSRLLGPLGMTCWYWWQDPMGYYFGGATTWYTPRDLAKFGLMVARHGMWDGRRIVSEDWLYESTRPQVPGSNYGWHWWAANIGGFPLACATGYGGQGIYAIPDLDLVVVTTTRSDEATVPQSYYDEPGQIIAQYILPAIQAAAPHMEDGGVVNAADYSKHLAAGSFASVFGSNLGMVTNDWRSAMPAYGALPEGVGGVTVKIGGHAAHPSYVSPSQVNVLIPTDLAPGYYSLQITTPRTTVTQEVEVAEVAPAFFAFLQDGKRMAAPEAVSAGEEVALWASGLGPSNPPLAPGTVLDHPRPLLYTPEVTVAGQPARVTYAGLAYAGVWQVNIRVPDGIAPGLKPVELRVGDVASSTEALLQIR